MEFRNGKLSNDLLIVLEDIVSSSVGKPGEVHEWFTLRTAHELRSCVKK